MLSRWVSTVQVDCHRVAFLIFGRLSSAAQNLLFLVPTTLYLSKERLWKDRSMFCTPENGGLFTGFSCINSKNFFICFINLSRPRQHQSSTLNYCCFFCLCSDACALAYVENLVQFSFDSRHSSYLGQKLVSATIHVKLYFHPVELEV